jgi:hypothetical protein
MATHLLSEKLPTGGFLSATTGFLDMPSNSYFAVGSFNRGHHIPCPEYEEPANYQGTWNLAVNYVIGQTVEYGGSFQFWRALQPSIGVTPFEGPPAQYRGSWNVTVTYGVGQTVSYGTGGQYWRALQTHVGVTPIEGPYWTFAGPYWTREQTAYIGDPCAPPNFLRWGLQRDGGNNIRIWAQHLAGYSASAYVDRSLAFNKAGSRVAFMTQFEDDPAGWAPNNQYPGFLPLEVWVERPCTPLILLQCSLSVVGASPPSGSPYGFSKPGESSNFYVCP